MPIDYNSGYLPLPEPEPPPSVMPGGYYGPNVDYNTPPGYGGQPQVQINPQGQTTPSNPDYIGLGDPVNNAGPQVQTTPSNTDQPGFFRRAFNHTPAGALFNIITGHFDQIPAVRIAKSIGHLFNRPGDSPTAPGGTGAPVASGTSRPGAGGTIPGYENYGGGFKVIGKDTRTGAPIYRNAAGQTFVTPGTGTPVNPGQMTPAQYTRNSLGGVTPTGWIHDINAGPNAQGVTHDFVSSLGGNTELGGARTNRWTPDSPNRFYSGVHGLDPEGQIEQVSGSRNSMRPPGQGELNNFGWATGTPFTIDRVPQYNAAVQAWMASKGGLGAPTAGPGTDPMNPTSALQAGIAGITTPNMIPLPPIAAPGSLTGMSPLPPMVPPPTPFTGGYGTQTSPPGPFTRGGAI